MRFALLATLAALLLAVPAQAATVVNFTVGTTSPQVGQAVAFTDASDASLRNATHAWSFGDGAHGTGLKVSHAFAKAGVYHVTLTVRNQTAAHDVTVSAPPPPPALVASFSFSPAKPVAGSPVAFVDTSSDADSSINRWTWDFGDGSNASAELRPQHAYAAAGNYTVTLTVGDAKERSATASRHVLVGTLTAGQVPPTPVNVQFPGDRAYAPGAGPLALLAILASAAAMRRRQ
jgi:PKD repeat protein